jgi:murein DD-endopeptidase MepM/ murein hydrolase activator NlpD
VISAGWLGGHGRTVVIQHPGGYQTVYAHMRQIMIPMGAEVDPGSPLGFVGSSGRSTGPHLHFEVRQGGVPLDPLDLVENASATRSVHASR